MTKVTIKDNTSVVSNVFDSRTDLAMGLMVRAVKSEARPNTPAKSGQLRKNVETSRKAFRKHEARWAMEYAAVQEAGKRNGSPIRNYTTAGTGSGFAEDAANRVTNDGFKYMRQAGLLKDG